MSEKITLATMKEIVASNKLKKVDFIYNKATIAINPILSLSEKSVFIDRVVDNCFTNEGEFLPEYVDLMTFITLIQMCSNVPVPKKDNVLDLQLGYEWMVATDLLDKIRSLGYINESTEDEKNLYKWFSDLEDCIANKIEFRKQEIIANKENSFDKLITSLSSLADTITNAIKNINVEEFAPLLKDIMPMLPNLLKNGKLDEKALVEAFVSLKEKNEINNEVGEVE